MIIRRVYSMCVSFKFSLTQSLPLRTWPGSTVYVNFDLLELETDNLNHKSSWSSVVYTVCAFVQVFSLTTALFIEFQKLGPIFAKPTFCIRVLLTLVCYQSVLYSWPVYELQLPSLRTPPWQLEITLRFLKHNCTDLPWQGYFSYLFYSQGSSVWALWKATDNYECQTSVPHRWGLLDQRSLARCCLCSTVTFVPVFYRLTIGSQLGCSKRSGIG